LIFANTFCVGRGCCVNRAISQVVGGRCRQQDSGGLFRLTVEGRATAVGQVYVVEHEGGRLAAITLEGTIGRLSFEGVNQCSVKSTVVNGDVGAFYTYAHVGQRQGEKHGGHVMLVAHLYCIGSRSRAQTVYLVQWDAVRDADMMQKECVMTRIEGQAIQRRCRGCQNDLVRLVYVQCLYGGLPMDGQYAGYCNQYGQ